MNNIDEKIIDNLNLGIIVLDEELNVVKWNNWMENLTGNKKDSVINKKLTSLYPLFEKNIYKQFIFNALNNGQKMFCSAALHPVFFPPTNNKNKIQQNLHIEPFSYDDKTFVLLQVFDATHHRKKLSYLQSSLKEMASFKEKAKLDGLTKLPNRGYFLEQLENIIKNYNYKETDYETKKLTLLFIDLDSFKEINDSIGHVYGDNLLKTVAKRIKSVIKETDLSARYGGDEFVILLKNIGSLKEITSVANRILGVVEEPIKLSGQEIYFSISLSIGVALYPTDSDSLEKLIEKADKAMYEAKRLGGNRCVFYSDIKEN
ncbi:GGDEF domain-containing protein [Natranaerofaba carboxydovora]|uniref:GGDEF domain-containing protein n=1 Tax=Natranaerofaba carboxydovora TaxID=2742683 RepID=UPI001F138F04|nr:GGDEF domain-containing protein [Natranaerofaba carboxydovora]UMZ73446.1 Cyclic di-GMP phosphodiesterase Gmr [Natranaerofaba carboxydovora]